MFVLISKGSAELKQVCLYHGMARNRGLKFLEIPLNPHQGLARGDPGLDRSLTCNGRSTRPMQWQAGEYNVYKFVANRNQGNYSVLCGSTFGMVGQKGQLSSN